MLILVARLLSAGHRRHVVFLLSGVVICAVAGAAAFSAAEHIAFASGLYWAVTTATTVGYGDVIPHNPAGRIIASAVMLTCIPMLGASFALIAGSIASAGIRKVLNMGNFPHGTYRLVIGDHPSVPAIIDELVKADDAVVLVADVDPLKVREEVHLVRGNPSDPATLRRARPEGAIHALLAADNDGDVLVAAVLLREQAPELVLSALVHSPSVSEALREIGVTQAVSVDQLVAHTMAKGLETPHASDLILQLLGSSQHKLVEIDASASMVGKALSQVRAEVPGLLLGLVRDQGVSLGIADDPIVAKGDRLLVAEPIRVPR